MLWLVDYVWQRLQIWDMATKAWVLAQGYATEAWVLAKGYLTTSFVDRGDPVNYDFAIGDLDLDGGWHDLDLSGIVPVGTKAVVINLITANSMAGMKCNFRTDGNLNVNNSGTLYIQVANMIHTEEIVIPLPTSRVIEYVFAPAGWILILFIVKGWWL